MSYTTSRAVLRRKLRRFWTGYVWWQKLLFPPVIIALGLARATVLALPLKHYAFILGRKLGPDNPMSASSEPSKRAAKLSRIIKACARLTPWDSNCLAQAMVAALLLRFFRIGYVVHFGLKRSATLEDGQLEAHAWTMAGTQPVTGFQASQGLAKVATFGWPREAVATDH